jgi:hypothetical protein
MLMNLSLHGCGIKGAPLLVWDVAAAAALASNQAQPVEVEQAVVRWVNDDQFGVSFLAVPPDVQARLEQVVRLLHEAQQLEEHVIPVSAFLRSDSGQRAESGAQRS